MMRLGDDALGLSGLASITVSICGDIGRSVRGHAGRGRGYEVEIQCESDCICLCTESVVYTE